jgi:hypothetical protein
MKSKQEIENARANVNDSEASEYPGMTYEQGVAEALGWVLGDVPDDEFGYAVT